MGRDSRQQTIRLHQWLDCFSLMKNHIASLKLSVKKLGNRSNRGCPMDVTTSKLVADATAPSLLEPRRETRRCIRNPPPGEFPLADIPTMVLHILTSYTLEPVDLAILEATCSFFRRPSNLIPESELPITEVAALEMCQKRAVFKPMKTEEREELKKRCGGSWKLVLRFLLAGEACYRREKSQVIAGDGHSVVVTPRGDVYTFGLNDSGQLGHSATDDLWKPRQISSMKGIRVIQAAAASRRTMLVTDSGQVYSFGRGKPAENGHGPETVVPEILESLKGVFVVQVVIGTYFFAVLSREGRVYTFCWGNEEKLGHNSDPDDLEPRPLLGALENIPVVQIGAGNCYLLALAFQPTGMSVYSVGCGMGGKLGHGSKDDEKQPRLIQQFEILDFHPIAMSVGTWHSAVLGHDGRVCTWGWGSYGCLGHGDDEFRMTPQVVEGLGDGKAVLVATGNLTTFVVLDNGDVYSFGTTFYGNLGHADAAAHDDEQEPVRAVLSSKLVTSLKELDERVVQVSLANSASSSFAHTIVLTESGKLLSLGRGSNGELGIAPSQVDQRKPQRIEFNLN